ncbi:hypothetical protein ARMSODRAFT_1010263 [Armillaria solidipes]|uniref:Uncharacterized protein n=1 Tax=Armillaria solidipes TaxID=1076256 RepID=A0A2H3C3G8_9AGAR|nr:hypothetical protein ARMSODRAFT_1010263 [Armillaria solidipes]
MIPYADNNCCLVQSSSSIHQRRTPHSFTRPRLVAVEAPWIPSFLSRIDLSSRAPTFWFALSVLFPCELAHHTFVSSLIDSWCKTSEKAALSPHRSPPPRHVQSTQPPTPPLSEYSPSQDLTYGNTIFPLDFLIDDYGGVRYCSRLFIGDILWPWMSEGECLKRRAHPNRFFSTSQASSLPTSPLNPSSPRPWISLSFPYPR